jgi:hypothetical protein
VTVKTVEKAQRAIDRANKLADRVEKAEEALYLLRKRAADAQSAAFNALPDGYQISLSRDEPWSLVAPKEEQAV